MSVPSLLSRSCRRDVTVRGRRGRHWTTGRCSIGEYGRRPPGRGVWFGNIYSGETVDTCSVGHWLSRGWRGHGSSSRRMRYCALVNLVHSIDRYCYCPYCYISVVLLNHISFLMNSIVKVGSVVVQGLWGIAPVIFSIIRVNHGDSGEMKK